MEAQVRWNGRKRAQGASSASRREHASDADRYRAYSGQAHPSGGALKKSLKAARKRELAAQIVEWYEVSVRHACGLLDLGGLYYYRSRRRQYTALRLRLRELALSRVRYGYIRLMVLLRREGWRVGKKLVYRLYTEMGLTLKSKRGRKLARRGRISKPPVADAPNQRWCAWTSSRSGSRTVATSGY